MTANLIAILSVCLLVLLLVLVARGDLCVIAILGVVLSALSLLARILP